MARSTKFEPLREQLKHTDSRATLVAELKASRAVRAAEKRQLQAVVLIQSIYRSRKSRRALHVRVLAEWMLSHKAKILDTSWTPNEVDLQEILRPVLFVLLPRLSAYWKLPEAKSSCMLYSLPSILRLSHSAVGTISGCLGLALRYIIACKQRKASFLDTSLTTAVMLIRSLVVLIHLVGDTLDMSEGTPPNVKLLRSVALRISQTLLQSDFFSHEYLCGQSTHLAQLNRLVVKLGAKMILARSAVLEESSRDQCAVTETELSSYLVAVLSVLDTSQVQESWIFNTQKSTISFILTIPHLSEKLPVRVAEKLAELALRQEFVLQGGRPASLPPTDVTVLTREQQLLCYANTLSLLLLAARKAATENDKQVGKTNAVRRATQDLIQHWTQAWRLEAHASSQTSTELEADGFYQASFTSAIWKLLEVNAATIQIFMEFIVLTCQNVKTSKKPNKNGPANSAVQGIISSLAFGCPNFGLVAWKFLATKLTMPLNVPENATQGWDFSSLNNGYDAVPPVFQSMLGLFCRVSCTQLLIQDDAEFSSSSLGHYRAVSLALNTLLFNAIQLRKGSCDQGLKQYGPDLLRALYERSERCSFCSEALWLAPYMAKSGSHSEGLKEAALESRYQWWLTGSEVYHPANPWDALLDQMPQCIPFKERLDFFRALISSHKTRELARQRRGEFSSESAVTSITVMRGQILQSGFDALQTATPQALRRKFFVKFVDQFGKEEWGQDGGGLAREFLEEVLKSGLENSDLMSTNADGLTYPSPASLGHPQGEALLEFLGSMLGKMLLEGMLLDVPLAPFFITRLQGRLPFFDELARLDPELHRSVLQVKKYEGDVSDLGLTFSVDDNSFGKTRSIPLLEDGEEMQVTNANTSLYVHLLIDWHLIRRPARAFAAFSRGMNKVLPTKWLTWFNTDEVNALLTGGSDGFDIDELAKHTVYEGGYSERNETIKLLWKTLKKLSPADRQAFLKFATSSSRPPLGGFAFLNPKFNIRRVSCDASMLARFGGKDVERLPTAATCFNQLKLPNYRRESTMRKMLLAAIHSGSGFELS